MWNVSSHATWWDRMNVGPVISRNLLGMPNVLEIVDAGGQNVFGPFPYTFAAYSFFVALNFLFARISGPVRDIAPCIWPCQEFGCDLHESSAFCLVNEAEFRCPDTIGNVSRGSGLLCEWTQASFFRSEGHGLACTCMKSLVDVISSTDSPEANCGLHRLLERVANDSIGLSSCSTWDDTTEASCECIAHNFRGDVNHTFNFILGLLILEIVVVGFAMVVDNLRFDAPKIHPDLSELVCKLFRIGSCGLLFFASGSLCAFVGPPPLGIGVVNSVVPGLVLTVVTLLSFVVGLALLGLRSLALLRLPPVSQMDPGEHVFRFGSDAVYTIFLSGRVLQDLGCFVAFLLCIRQDINSEALAQERYGLSNLQRKALVMPASVGVAFQGWNRSKLALRSSLGQLRVAR